MNAGVELDWSELERDMATLASGLGRIAATVPRSSAERVAARLRAGLPVRSGRLRGSVHIVSDTRSAGVSYGAGVPYANYIDHRTGAVDDACAGAETEFETVCASRTDVLVNRL